MVEGTPSVRQLWKCARWRAALEFWCAAVALLMAAGLFLPMPTAWAAGARSDVPLLVALDGMTPLGADALANASARGDGAGTLSFPQIKAQPPPVKLWDDVGPALVPAIGRTTVTITAGPGSR